MPLENCLLTGTLFGGATAAFLRKTALSSKHSLPGPEGP